MPALPSLLRDLRIGYDAESTNGPGPNLRLDHRNRIDDHGNLPTEQVRYRRAPALRVAPCRKRVGHTWPTQVGMLGTVPQRPD